MPRFDRLLGWWSVIGLILLVSAATAQAPGAPSTTEFSAYMKFLEKPEVAKELDLTKEQIEAIEELVASRAVAERRLLERAGDADRLTPEERKAFTNGYMQHLVEANAKLEKILLPHQLSRLRQLIRQYQLARFASSFGLLSPSVKEAVQITDAQSDKITSIADETQAKIRVRMEEVRKEIAEMESRARQQMIDNLSAEQREKFESLVGKPFSLEVLQKQQFKARPGA